MASSKSSRRLARRKAFELLFELEQHPGLDAPHILERSFSHPDVLEVYAVDEDADGYVVVPVVRIPPPEPTAATPLVIKRGRLLPAPVRPDIVKLAPQAEGIRHFVSELVMAVVTNRKAIDTELSKYPEDWSFDRIGRSERILLQLAVAEMVYLGTSYKVVIDEILDIAKLYAQEDATRFINGILGAVVRNLPALRQSTAPAEGTSPAQALKRADGTR
jgi:transcription antitermination protein NusB